MTRRMIAAVAVLGLVVAAPAVAQDEGTSVAVAYVDDTVDGPIAEAVSALDQRYGLDTRAVEAWTLFLEGADVPDCVVVAGLNGDRVASGLAYSTNGVEVTSAQGADRHETAKLVAVAVADCRD